MKSLGSFDTDTEAPESQMMVNDSLFIFKAAETGVPPVSAHRLHDAWPRSRLVIVPKAGHALSEPGISAELVRVIILVAFPALTLWLPGIING